MDKNKTIIIGLVFLVLAGLWLQSTAWFRLQLADYYADTGSYDKAIVMYKKVLRKAKFNKNRVVNFEQIANIHFNLANLYVRKEISGKAVREYTKAFSINPSIDRQILLPLKKAEDYKNFATAFLEEGVCDKAIEYFNKMRNFTLDNTKVKKYILIANEMKDYHSTLNHSFYFSIGEQYIDKKLWHEARDFFTKRILKNVSPLMVLEYLNQHYNVKGRADIRNKIWGKNIYVVLEDFEKCKEPLFANGPRDTEPIVNIHKIAEGVFSSGKCSEYFDISYPENGHYNYWFKPINISVSRTNLALGLRIFVKSRKPFNGDFRLSIAYPESGAHGVIHSDTNIVTFEDWQMLKIDNILEKAKMNAIKHEWDTRRINIRGVFINTGAKRARFYVDDIELYLECPTGGII